MKFHADRKMEILRILLSEISLSFRRLLSYVGVDSFDADSMCVCVCFLVRSIVQAAVEHTAVEHTTSGVIGGGAPSSCADRWAAGGLSWPHQADVEAPKHTVTGSGNREGVSAKRVFLQRKIKGQLLKCKIVSALFTLFGASPHVFTLFQSFSEFYLQDFFLELRGFTTVLVQRDEKQIKENKRE